MFLRFNFFTIIWAVVILLLILMPGQQMPQTGNLFSFDKIAHLGVFSVLSFLMIHGLAKQSAMPGWRKHSKAYGVLISATYAGLLEFGQSLIPERNADYYDMAFNLSGVFLGFLIFLLIYKFSIVSSQFK
ncbi:MAG: VanZ family protein [Cyclobacteriaceae bacterium]|nr:VanZ family protein [Cyclobacteriaceae bacterium]